jgi:hypothetical protein
MYPGKNWAVQFKIALYNYFSQILGFNLDPKHHLKVVGRDDGDVGGLDAGGHKAAHVMAHQGGFTLVT